MRTGTRISDVAALVGDAARANMLEAVMDGRALTATELAVAAGVTAATASGHLARLTAGGLLAVTRQGRHRYFRLASADIARMLEGLMVVARQTEERPRATPRVPAALLEARTCYDHLAGRVAVAITDALIARRAIVLTAEAGEVTDAGRALLEDCGLDLGPRGRRQFCRPCLDWSERRPHLAGVIGAELLRLSLERGWVLRRPDSRAATVTEAGRQAYADLFGADLRVPRPEEARPLP